MSPKNAVLILIAIVVAGGLFVYYLSVIGRDAPAGLDLADFGGKQAAPAPVEKKSLFPITASSTEEERQQAILELERAAAEVEKNNPTRPKTEAERQQMILELEKAAAEVEKNNPTR